MRNANSALEEGLAAVEAEQRALAGRLLLEAAGKTALHSSGRPAPMLVAKAATLQISANSAPVRTRDQEKVRANRVASRRAAALDDDVSDAIGRTSHGQLVEVGDKLVMPPPAARPKKKRRRLQILDEDTYIDSLTEIITRDFFPDLRKLRQVEEIGANDTERLHKPQAKSPHQPSVMGSTRASSTSFADASPLDTPASMADLTPCRDGDVDCLRSGMASGNATLQNDEGPVPQVINALSLDKFHDKYTSEDNESFEEILERDEDKRLDKIQWMHDVAHNYTHKQLMLKNAPVDDFESRPTHLQSWEYRAKNSLLWNPSAIGKLKDVVEGPPKQVIHANTRLRSDTNSARASQSTVSLYPASPGQGGGGRDAPFLVTPSPMPGVDDSPMMTWGDLGATPHRLDGDMAGGPRFSLAATPAREETGMQLAAEAQKRRSARHPGENSLSARGGGRRQQHSGVRRPHSALISRANGLPLLSPAAQRLVGRSPRHHSSDSELRASYARVPGATTGRERTRSIQRGSGSLRSSSCSPAVGINGRAQAGNVTDGLLKL
jgi:protein DGCR14